tara:strand:+ start:70 stop:453 length:384 start_codon:yes stop_codon:yes gene_type:complete
MIVIYKYFTDEELACSHCNKMYMHMGFMRKIEELRELLGFPFIVTSGFRCRVHPIEVRKNSPGPHTTGQALDINVYGNNAHRLLDAALRAGFNGVGIAQKGGHSERFIHLDDLSNSDARPRPTVWSY